MLTSHRRQAGFLTSRRAPVNWFFEPISLQSVAWPDSLMFSELKVIGLAESGSPSPTLWHVRRHWSLQQCVRLDRYRPITPLLAANYIMAWILFLSVINSFPCVISVHIGLADTPCLVWWVDSKQANKPKRRKGSKRDPRYGVECLSPLTFNLNAHCFTSRRYIFEYTKAHLWMRNENCID